MIQDELVAALVEVLADLVAFLELSDESVLETDAAVGAMEGTAHVLRQLNPTDRGRLVQAVIELAGTIDDRVRRELVTDLPGSLGLL